MMLCATLPERLGKTGTACYNTECAYSLLEVVEIMEFVLGRVHFGCDIDSYQDEKSPMTKSLLVAFVSYECFLIALCANRKSPKTKSLLVAFVSYEFSLRA